MIVSLLRSKQSLLVVTLLLMVPTARLLAAELKSARPNFILINIDDLGYADIGSFGSKLSGGK